MSIWYSAWTAASRAAPRRLALRPLGAAAMRSGRNQAALKTYQRECGARGVAAFVTLFRTSPRPGLHVIVDRNNAIADRHSAGARDIHQTARRFKRHDLKMDGVAPNNAAKRHNAFVGLA